jgi:hypothetical protein
MKEQPKNNLESPEEKLKNFREEIQAIIEREKTEEKTADFLFFLNEGLNLNVGELLLEDMEIWEKVKNNTVTREELSEYKKSCEDPEAKMKEETGKFASPMRYAFYGFIMNEAIPEIISKEMEKSKS